MVPAACTKAMIWWEERRSGRSRSRRSKGGRERSEGEECRTSQGERWRVEGRRGMRRLPSGELAFTKHQNGTYRGPVISPYSRLFVLVRGSRERDGERERKGGKEKERSDLAPLPLLRARASSKRRRWRTAWEMSVSSIPAFLVALPDLKTHPAKEPPLSRLPYWQGPARREDARLTRWARFT